METSVIKALSRVYDLRGEYPIVFDDTLRVSTGRSGYEGSWTKTGYELANLYRKVEAEIDNLELARTNLARILSGLAPISREGEIVSWHDSTERSQEEEKLQQPD